MVTMSALLGEIEQFCKDADIAEATFGSRVVRDGKFVKRLRDGGDVTLKTVDRVRAYIAAERAKQSPKRRSRPQVAA